ncbi:neural Wiskott-Aldrich syndrome protein-like [Pipistrellus kuhlii]|uniref:neural Wiskott-Aldrich syndrome protein-like n=1 Tax=Pipistrellus kuhlii TaxID=59472 RepID=UPI001E2721AA|nr:neural Wiskott-Aldrich syndrome protein-like [Pipistrellus kuhlii]
MTYAHSRHYKQDCEVKHRQKAVVARLKNEVEEPEKYRKQANGPRSSLAPADNFADGHQISNSSKRSNNQNQKQKSKTKQKRKVRKGECLPQPSHPVPAPTPTAPRAGSARFQIKTTESHGADPKRPRRRARGGAGSESRGLCVPKRVTQRPPPRTPQPLRHPDPLRTLSPHLPAADLPASPAPAPPPPPRTAPGARDTPTRAAEPPGGAALPAAEAAGPARRRGVQAPAPGPRELRGSRPPPPPPTPPPTPPRGGAAPGPAAEEASPPGTPEPRPRDLGMRRRRPLGGEGADVNKARGRPIPATPPRRSPRPLRPQTTRGLARGVWGWQRGLGEQISREQGQPRGFRKCGAPGGVVRGGGGGGGGGGAAGTEEVALPRWGSGLDVIHLGHLSPW